MTSSTAPQLQGEALDAILQRGSHLQIIASAGSGKTEVVAQRVAQLMADGADPAGIIAFTFTKRAAGELKARISARVEERLGSASLDNLGAAFVGTIHSYCFRLLQQHVPRYETFDVLDEGQLTAFLCREEPALHLRNLTGKVFTSIKAFRENLEVVENELIPLQQLDNPFKGMAERFYELLEQFRFLTYGQQISRALAELEKPDVAGKVRDGLQHLIVDEYQDVNPAQERLIRLLTGRRSNCVSSATTTRPSTNGVAPTYTTSSISPTATPACARSRSRSTGAAGRTSSPLQRHSLARSRADWTRR